MFIVNLYRNTGFSNLFPQKSTVSETATGSMKYFYSREFIIPSKEERVFDEKKPIGLCFADFATYSIIEQDEPSKKIYRGCIVGIPSISLRVHKVHAGLYLKDMLQEAFSTGVAWSRSIEFRCDGTVMVLLNKYIVVDVESNSTLVQHQDVTEQFAHLL